MDPAKEGLMTHFDCHKHDFVQGKEHRDLHNDRQTARGGINLFPLVHGHHLLVHLLPVSAVAFPQLGHFGLQSLHLAHGLVGFIGQGEKDQFDANGQEQDG